MYPSLLLALAASLATPALAQTTAATNSSLYAGYNGVFFGSNIFYPLAGQTVNHNDVLVFTYFSNGSSNAVFERLGNSEAGVGNLTAMPAATAMVSPTGTFVYSLTTDPSQLATSYPYTANFAIANSLSAAGSGGPTLTNHISIVVVSTAGNPVVYAQSMTSGGGAVGGGVVAATSTSVVTTSVAMTTTAAAVMTSTATVAASSSAAAVVTSTAAVAASSAAAATSKAGAGRVGGVGVVVGFAGLVVPALLLL